jgi:hypothetical protein
LPHRPGDRVTGMADTQEPLTDASTYGGRSTRSIRTLGAIINNVRFTLQETREQIR